MDAWTRFIDPGRVSAPLLSAAKITSCRCAPKSLAISSDRSPRTGPFTATGCSCMRAAADKCRFQMSACDRLTIDWQPDTVSKQASDDKQFIVCTTTITRPSTFHLLAGSPTAGLGLAAFFTDGQTARVRMHSFDSVTIYGHKLCIWVIHNREYSRRAGNRSQTRLIAVTP